jgi:GLPGLI family protein
MKPLALILSLSLLFVFYDVNAQTKGELIYTKLINDQATSSARTENYIVYFDKDRSIEINRPVAAQSKIRTTTGVNESTVYLPTRAGDKNYFLLKDFKANRLTLGDRVILKYYLIEDTLANFKWVITNEQKQILKFNCTKATTSFRGRKYEVWFTDEVPLRNGPWKFCGLPGLIVKVYDTENIYTFDLVAINFGEFEDSKLQVPAQYIADKPIKHPVFMEAYKKKVKDLEIESRASAFVKGNTSGSTKFSIPPLVEKF